MYGKIIDTIRGFLKLSWEYLLLFGTHLGLEEAHFIRYRIDLIWNWFLVFREAPFSGLPLILRVHPSPVVLIGSLGLFLVLFAKEVTGIYVSQTYQTVKALYPFLVFLGPWIHAVYKSQPLHEENTTKSRFSSLASPFSIKCLRLGFLNPKTSLSSMLLAPVTTKLLEAQI